MTATSPLASRSEGFSFRAAMRRPSVIVAILAFLAVASVWGVLLYRAAQPETLDQRVRDVASQIQCPVCNGESVEDSPSGLAAEMRALIREKLSHGESEQQVIQYFEASYGDTILESPPVSGFTLLIWLPPVVMLALGGYLVFTVGKEWGAQRGTLALAGVGDDDDDVDSENDEASGLSVEERRRLREALLRELERDEGLPFSGASMREGR